MVVVGAAVVVVDVLMVDVVVDVATDVVDGVCSVVVDVANTSETSVVVAVDTPSSG